MKIRKTNKLEIKKETYTFFLHNYNRKKNIILPKRILYHQVTSNYFGDYNLPE